MPAIKLLHTSLSQALQILTSNQFLRLVISSEPFSQHWRFSKLLNYFIVSIFQGAEPKILETYSKLAMKDAIEYMQRNASTIGNISGAESMSAIFKNYTNANFNGRQEIISCRMLQQVFFLYLQIVRRDILFEIFVFRNLNLRKHKPKKWFEL